ncbi:MAG: YunC family protein [Candidatus Hadarchaeales archaeon]
MSVEIKEMEIGGGKVLLVKVELPEAPLLLALAPKGYMMCGYLNIETAEKLNQVAAIVMGVKSFSEMLEAKVVAATRQAMERGVKEGMSGREAILKMF